MRPRSLSIMLKELSEQSVDEKSAAEKSARNWLGEESGPVVDMAGSNPESPRHDFRHAAGGSRNVIRVRATPVRRALQFPGSPQRSRSKSGAVVAAAPHEAERDIGPAQAKI